MSEVVNIPQLRFPEFNGEWEEKALGVVATITTGSTPSTSNNEYYDGDVAFVSPADIQGNRIVRSTKTTITELGLSVVREIKKRSTLFVCIGSTIGKVSQAGVNCATNQQINALTAKNSFDNDFIYSLLEFKAPRIKLLAGVQAVPQINKSEFSRFKFTFPLLPEQQKIAAFLTAVDNKIEQLSKKQELLGEYKKGLMQQIFSQAIRFKADDGSEFPDWEEKNGNEIFDNISNKNHDSDLPILAITQEHGAIPRDLINYKMIVSDKSVSSYKVVETGDFIISLRSFQGGIEYSNYKGICSPAYIILRPAIEIEKKFYKYYLKTYRYIQDLNRKLEGIRDGKMVSYKYFSEIKLPYPSISEQAKIANFLSSIDNKIEQVGKQLDESKQFKKALLQQMFV